MATFIAVILVILLALCGISLIYIATCNFVWSVRFAKYRLVDFVRSKRDSK